MSIGDNNGKIFRLCVVETRKFNVIGILNRWRQFGRRYFWPHLLWGMVAATLGVPNALANTEQTKVADPSTSLQRLINAHNTNEFSWLQASKRRGSFQSIDYWHQHALRTAIRHLSYRMTPQVTASEPANDIQVDELHAQQLVLLSSLSSLLTLQPAITPSTPVLLMPKLDIAPNAHAPALWVAQVQGIRAGPQLSYI